MLKLFGRKCKKHLGYRVPLGAPSAYTKPADYEPTASEKQKKLPTSNNDEALKMLAMRFAKGEITKEQYQELKDTLEEDSAQARSFFSCNNLHDCDSFYPSTPFG